MATRTITTRLAIDGESEYRAALKNISADLALHKSELSKVEARYKESANSLTALGEKELALKHILTDLSARHSEHTSALEKSRAAQREYAAQVERAKAKLDALKTSTGDTADQQRALEEELAAAEVNLKKAANSVTYYQKQVNNTEKDQLNFGSELRKTQKYMKEGRVATDGHATSIDQYGKKTNQAAKEMKNANDTMNAMAAALAAAGITRGLREIVDALKACVGASVEFESAMAGVFKTVDGSDAQLAAISDGIKRMSTEIPATTEEIAAVAEAAGQLGIATDDVLSFSRVMLDLGESTNLSADEAATALARFANITGTSAADYERLGSVIVGLGNNFATTEREITEMATRLASAGTLAGLTEPEIMALSTAMSSVGIESEAGGTAMTQTLTAMEKAAASGGKNLEEFARISGMTASEFKTAWETEAITALQAFISGLGKLDEQGESATLVLDEMGLSGVRQSNMLKSLALASDTLTGAVGLANQAWAENTALTDEANKRYETTESKLAMMNNAFTNVKAAVGDTLAPALREVAEAGTDAFSWAAEFIERNPWLVQALAGVTTTLITFTETITGFHKLTAMVEGATGALSALQIVLTDHPVVAVATAIAGLTVAVGAFVASAKEASAESRELIDGLEESQKAFEETAEGIQKESDNVLSMITALENLAAVEVKSAAQKQAMAGLVDQLNQSVPDLSLAYDAETDSLTDMATGAEMTAASIRELAKAQAEQQMRDAETERLTGLYIEQAQIADNLAAARERLGAASAKQAQMEAEGTWGTTEHWKAVQEVTGSLVEEKRIIQELTAEQNANSEAVEELAGKYGTATDAAEGISGATKEAAAQTEALTAALKEQEAQGRLSEATAQSLISAGYESALVTDAETGAVRLNQEAYIQAAQAKLDEQIASLETQRQSVNTAIQLKAEAYAALILAGSYVEARAAKDELDGLVGQSKAHLAQIRSLEELKKSLGSYTAATDTAARASASSSRKMQTQAEKDLAKYKELKAELDHQKAMDQVSEREYYERLKEYRDRYLTDEDNLDEYRRITEQIYSYDKSLVDKSAALWEEQTGTLISELESRTKAILDEQSGMEEKLAGYGDLFTMEGDKMSLESIEEQTKAIQDYGNTLQQLKDKGVTGDLLNEIIGMGVDDATAFGNQLINMDPGDLEAYIAAWDEKQEEAARIAREFYQDQLDALETEYNDKLGEALGTMTGTAFTSGQDTAESMINGLKDKEPALYAQAQRMADEIYRILSSAYAAIGVETIGASKSVDGSHAGGLPYVPFNGYIAELHQGERVLTKEEAQAYIARSIPNSFELPSANRQPDIGSMLSQAVNAMSTVGSNLPVMPAKIILQTPEAKTVATWLLPDLRGVMKSNPEVVSDL